MKNVLIMGSGRSGTSMAAGMLAKAGYFMGPNLMPATPGNPKGYFESFDIETINEDILKLVIPSKPKYFKFFFKNRPGKGHYWLTALDTNVIVKGKPSIQKKIADLTTHTPYCFKDPRFCYTLPIWRPLLAADTAFVCIFRNPSETVSSILRECRREQYLADYPVNRQLAYDVWKRMYTHILEKHRRSGQWVFLHYRQLFTESGQDRLASLTGAAIDRDFPDQSLHRSRPQESTAFEIDSIYRQLCALAEYG
jgi:hypothetical protein